MNHRKMTLSWSFSYSYNSLVKYHGENIWEPQFDPATSIFISQPSIYGVIVYFVTWVTELLTGQ